MRIALQIRRARVNVAHARMSRPYIHGVLATLAFLSAASCLQDLQAGRGGDVVLGRGFTTPRGGGGGSALGGERESRQCFAWSPNASIARQAFAYPDAATGERRAAARGDLIAFHCDGVVCPNPPRPDCFMRDVCGEGEWCMLQDQMRLGPWAMAGQAGETPNFTDRDCAGMKAAGFEELFQEVCQNQTHWGPWKAARGQCVKYRGEQQSCNGYLAGDDSSGLSPQYTVDSVSGAPPKRPLLCGPGLVCTGDVGPVPSTCVKARPPNVCYQGPWWDSQSWCARGGSEEHPGGGLSLDELRKVAPALLIQLPVEVYKSPSNPVFWSDPLAESARNKIQAIVKTLWPEQYRSRTAFPLRVPDPRSQGPAYGEAWNRTTAKAEALYRQPNKLWATVHTLIHNCRDPMPSAEVQASRMLAVWLRQHFMCCNCRGFFAEDVLDVVGLPPESSAREDHVRWWWKAHNMVNEHAAATRGGHPWIWPAMTDADFKASGAALSPLLECQNPWFLPFEAVHKQWDITSDN